MPFNREITAALAFESEAAISKGGDFSENIPRNHEPKKDEKDSPLYIEKQTKNIIGCLKWALARSITSISHPAKQRALNPKKDFSIQSRIDVKIDDPPLSMSCCGGRSGVKQQKRIFSVQEDGSGESDSDPGGLDEDPPVSFTLIDYSPMCYRHIREFFGINASSYCDVLVRSQWHSMPTPGKSSARLFFCGKDWVIKTMTDEESKFLCSILHRYYFHVLDNPYTLLPHFVGHHRLEIEGEKLNFIIMQNVFATGNTIHEKYDLKGSTVGRYAKNSEKMKQTCTQKDLDLNRPINIGSKRRSLLIEQIEKDCEFLKHSSIMDYSFLVGIHKPPAYDSRKVPNVTPGGRDQVSCSTNKGPSDKAVHSPNRDVAMKRTISQVTIASDCQCIDGRCFTSDQGGMMSKEQSDLSREIYYVGIIDILQQYTMRKQLETIFYGTINDRKKISSVPPAQYARRFLSFISCIFV